MTEARLLHLKERRTGPQLVREKLTEEQLSRVKMFLEDPLNGAVLETLSKVQGLNDIALYGGSALILALNVNLKPFLMGPYADERIDPQKWGDADWVVNGLEEIDPVTVSAKLKETLSHGSSEEVDVKIVKGDYPRIDLLVNKIERASISSLEASAGHVRRIKAALGQESPKDDWETYLGGGRLTNMIAIIFTEGNLQKAELLRFKDGPLGLIRLNEAAVESVSIFEKLNSLGEKKLAREVLRGTASWIGRMLLLPSYGAGFGVHSQKLNQLVSQEIKTMVEKASPIELMPAREVLSAAIARAVGADLLGARMNIVRMGAMRLFSPTLAESLESNYSRPNEFKWLTDLINEASLVKKEFPEVAKTMNGYLLLLGLGTKMSQSEFFQVLNEIGPRWQPKSLDQLAVWGGWQPVEPRLHLGLLQEVWKEVTWDKSYLKTQEAGRLVDLLGWHMRKYRQEQH